MKRNDVYYNFFKNILLYMNGRLSKIRSVRMLWPERFILIESVGLSFKLKDGVTVKYNHIDFANES